MTSFPRHIALGALAAIIGVGSGAARVGVTEIDGQVLLHVRPEPSAIIKGGPTNSLPTSGPYAGDEPLTLEFAACCVEKVPNEDLALEWDFNFDGVSFDPQAAGAGPVSHTYGDGPLNTLVALRLTSTNGAYAIVAEPVTVHNVAPTASIGGPYTGSAGTPVTFNGTATDPSAADTAAGLLYEWDFLYNGTFQPDTAGLDLKNPTRSFSASGVSTVALRVTDKDGGVSAIKTTTVSISTSVGLTSSITDSYIYQGAATANYGAGTIMYVQSKANLNQRSLVRFDLGPSGIPVGSTVLSATLALAPSATPAPSRTYGAYGITADWSEGLVNWSNGPSTRSTATATAATPSTVSWMSWDVTADVQAFVNGSSSNLGWMIKDMSEGDAAGAVTGFFTKECPNEEMRPKLVITYRAP